MGFTTLGGYVFTTSKRSFMKQARVTDKTLQEIAAVLGIKIPSDTISIAVYRGGKPIPKRAAAKRRRK